MPHYLHHDNTDHRPLIKIVSDATYTTTGKDDTLRLEGAVDVTLHDPVFAQYITLVQGAGVSTISGTGFSATIAQGVVYQLLWTGTYWQISLTGNASGGGSGGVVSSVFGRVGDIAPAVGDYNASQITNAFDKSSDTSDGVPEGTTNLYFTDARVAANAEVAANKAYREEGHIPLAAIGANDGVAELDSAGLLPVNRLPAIAVTNIYKVVSEAAQLSLSVEKGDICVRSDENRTYVALNSTNNDMGDWEEYLSPGRISSVNGSDGPDVLLNTDNIPEGSTNLYFTDARVASNAEVAANTADRHTHAANTLWTRTGDVMSPETIGDSLSIGGTIGIGGAPSAAALHIYTVGPGIRVSDPTNTASAEWGFEGPSVLMDLSGGPSSYGVRLNSTTLYRASADRFDIYTSTIGMFGTSIGGIAEGTTDNDRLVTKGYVDDNGGSGGISTEIHKITADLDMSTGGPYGKDLIIYADTTNNNINIVPPAPSAFVKLTIIKTKDANTVKLSGTVNDTADPALLTKYEGFRLISDGTSMYRIETTDLLPYTSMLLLENGSTLELENGTPLILSA